jgi:hypothetical protein
MHVYYSLHLIVEGLRTKVWPNPKVNVHVRSQNPYSAITYMYMTVYSGTPL